MIELRKRVEQLEAAAHLIDQDTLHSARLGLILLDNFAEIIMYDRAKHEFARDKYYYGSSGPRWNARKRHKVLDDFDAKVNFFTSEVSLISSDDGEFLKVAHQVRNKAYHIDAYHYDIIRQFTRTSFGMLCKLYPVLRRPGIMTSMSKDESRFLKRFGLESWSVFDGEKPLGEIFVKLAASRNCDPDDFAAALSRNLVRRIQEIIGNDNEYGRLEVLCDGRPRTEIDPEGMLKWIQFIDSNQNDSTQNGELTDEEFRVWVQKWESDFNEYVAPITIEKLRKWKSTAESLGSSRAAGPAAIRFRSIDEQLDPIEASISQAMLELDLRSNQ